MCYPYLKSKMAKTNLTNRTDSNKTCLYLQLRHLRSIAFRRYEIHMINHPSLLTMPVMIMTAAVWWLLYVSCRCGSSSAPNNETWPSLRRPTFVLRTLCWAAIEVFWCLFGSGSWMLQFNLGLPSCSSGKLNKKLWIKLCYVNIWQIVFNTNVWY